MRRTKEAAARTRDEIFRAGIKVFAQKGYSEGTLGDVASEAGVTRGAIYWHFKSKEAFIQETIARLNHAYDDLISNASNSGKDPALAIEDAVIAIIRRFIHDHEFRRMQELLMRTVLTHRGACGTHKRPINRVDKQAGELLDGAMRRGLLYSNWSSSTAQRAIGSVIAGVFLMILEEAIEPSEQEIRQIAAFVRRGIAPAPLGENV